MNFPGNEEDRILRYLLEAEKDESDPDDTEQSYPAYDNPLEVEEEDHVSDSDHDSATEADDTDDDPDYIPDDDRSRFQQILAKRPTRFTPGFIEQLNNSNDVEMEQGDPYYDSAIIPPSDEDEYQDYINNINQAREHVVREMDSVDRVIEDVVMGLNTVDEVIEDVVAGVDDHRRRNVLLGKDQVTT